MTDKNPSSVMRALTGATDKKTAPKEGPKEAFCLRCLRWGHWSKECKLPVGKPDICKCKYYHCCYPACLGT